MITTSVVGNVLVMSDPDGDLETMVGTQRVLDWVQVHALLRGAAGDHYDFMSCYLDVASGVVNLGAASDTIYQDARGIGRHLFDFRSTWGTTKLQHHSHFSFFNLAALLHELGHRWLAYVNYATVSGGPAETLLHQDWIWNPGQAAVHWGRWLDDQNSCMDYDQAEWIDNADGTFDRLDRLPENAAHEQWFGYSALDQYLMGLVPASAVPDCKIVRNPAPALSEAGPYGSVTGPYTPSPSTLTVTMAQVQHPRSGEPATFSGPRDPSYLNTQRVFHEAIVVITKDPSLSSTFIANSENWRRRHTENFRRVTSGRATCDTSLLRGNYAELYVRDNAADRGTGASGAPFWLSPDLWVRNADDGGLTDEPTVRGSSNWVHVRVRNKSAQPYANVIVNVYRANFAGTEFLYPVDWNPSELIGTATLATVPAASGGVEGEAIAKVEWTADRIPPATGWHSCILCEVIPMEVTPSGLHHVFENRKLAQRNLTIIDPPPSPEMADGGGGYMFAFDFAIGHPLREARATRLEMWTERRRHGTQLFLDPAGLVDGLATDADLVDWAVPLDATRSPAGARGIQWIDEVPAYESPADALACTGVTIAVRKGTELGILPDPARGDCSLQLRFEDDTRIRIGGRSARAVIARHDMRGLRPVIVNGLPLLEVTDPVRAALTLPLVAGRHTLRIIGVVRGPVVHHGALYHLQERLGDRVLGGVTLRINA